MKNVDRWFILIGLLYGSFGFAFGIWVGINQRFEQAHLHAHINLVGFASMVLFGLLYRTFPSLAESNLAGIHFVLFNLGAIIFLAGIPLAPSQSDGGARRRWLAAGARRHAHLPRQLLPQRVQRARGEGAWLGLIITSVRARGKWRQARCARPRPGRAAASAR